jgi:hypothetical protein
MALDERDHRLHPIAEIAINRMVHTRLHRVPTADREQRDNEREAEKVPGREANVDRQAFQVD